VTLMYNFFCISVFLTFFVAIQVNRVDNSGVSALVAAARAGQLQVHDHRINNP